MSTVLAIQDRVAVSSRASLHEQQIVTSMDDSDRWLPDTLRNNDLASLEKRIAEDRGFLESRDSFDETPLTVAIDLGHLEAVRLLLSNGADPDCDVDDGYTCLLSAVESQSENADAILSALIAAGAQVVRTGINGWAPLHMAAARGKAEMARLLIENGAEVDQRLSIDGQETPLMEAVHAGRPEVVQLLLDHGADPALRDTVYGATPVEIARRTLAGPDNDVYEILKKESIEISFDDLDLTEAQRELIQSASESTTLAEQYLKNAKELVDSGEHPEVIRILELHTQ